ncbi:IS1634 family transposase [Desulfitobacterium hafniense]|uniref:IS1634 family transposase n=1 Tax=Desulfitobacterium hafniense TaxID=49338 RepID=UPI0000543142|nr:transposase [Desulfitobacterium hafniense]
MGAVKYVKSLTFDPKTCVVLKDVKQLLRFIEEKLEQEDALDGYYAIVTSEYKESDERIIEIYRGLWKIEESFKITESDFETRPIYLSREEHIRSHFLTCFVALVIASVLAYRMKGKHSVSAIIESLEKCSCSHNQKNYYLFDYYDEILADIGQEFNIDFGRKCMSLGELKKTLGKVKKG